LWDAGTGRMVAELSDPAGVAPSPDKPLPSQAAFSTDGTRLAVAGARLTLYDGRTGTALRTVDAGRWERVHCVELRDDGGATLVLGTSDATFVRRMTPDLDVWDDVPLDHPENPDQDIAFAARGLILTGRRTPTLHLLRPPRMSLPHADLGADFGLPQMAISGDGSRFATLAFPRYTPTARPTTAQEQMQRVRSRLQVWDGRTLRPISR